MQKLFGVMAAAFLCSASAPFSDNPPTGKVLTGSGLVCDTKEQAQRFISLMDDDVEKTLLTVNREAGNDHACVVATIGFIPGSKVAEVDKNGSIVHVIEVKVVAVATVVGLQAVEPKTYYSVVATDEISI
ncbi:hypothetical protein [Pseudorhodoplanes sp.]|uniref:hypothetical protein n=1 Tax=Pseudorhodoplanes sp. TaxID=1934341 RepID=UPI002CADC1C6|nr:hypothetical protein [Pseudorhodoplanes sp.]HWV52815.1 hypothetical protein [Pseudorhodoplanes sp.]